MRKLRVDGVLNPMYERRAGPGRPVAVFPEFELGSGSRPVSLVNLE